jgi:hypothetical protein
LSDWDTSESRHAPQLGLHVVAELLILVDLAVVVPQVDVRPWRRAGTLAAPQHGAKALVLSCGGVPHAEDGEVFGAVWSGA